MKKTRINKQKIIVVSVLIVIFAVFIIWYLTMPDYENLARCLSSNNVTMYGTEWCTHCKAQKKMFGDSFQYINFVDCDISKDVCEKEGIKGYPTWDIAGHKVAGELEAEALSKLTGCPIK